MTQSKKNIKRNQIITLCTQSQNAFQIIENPQGHFSAKKLKHAYSQITLHPDKKIVILTYSEENQQEIINL